MKKAKTTAIIILFISVVCLAFHCLNLSAELDFANSSCRRIKGSFDWKKKRLRTYIQIVFITDSINESNATTKKAKKNNKNLQDLTQSLNNGTWKQEKN